MQPVGVGFVRSISEFSRFSKQFKEEDDDDVQEGEWERVVKSEKDVQD